MTRVLKNRPMLIALILASLSQFLAITGDQYILNLDFRIERLAHSIEFNKSLQSDLQNTVKVLRRAARYRDESWLSSYFDDEQGLKNPSQSSIVEIEKNLEFMTEEVRKIYKVYSMPVANESIDESSNREDVADIYSFAEPLYEKINQTRVTQNKQLNEMQSIEDARHLVLILAVIAQMLSLLSLLWFFLIELRIPASKF